MLRTVRLRHSAARVLAEEPCCPGVIPKLPHRAGAILALVVANLIWGTTFVATKPLLDHVPPLTLASGRFAIALLVLLPILTCSGRRPILSRTTAAMGFTGVFVVSTCQNLGLRHTGAANGALIHGGIPALTALLAAPALGERLGRGRLAGLALSLAGVAAVILPGSGGQFGLAAVGDGLVLLSALGLAAYIVLGRRAFPSGDALELVAGAAIFGLLFLLPASGIELGRGGLGWPTAGDLLGLLYLGAAASALAFVLWAYGLRHLEAGPAAAFANLNPVVGVVVAAIVLDESISVPQVVGGLLILGGVWLVTRQPARVVPGAARSSPGGHRPRRSRDRPGQSTITSRPAARACAPTRAAGAVGVGGGRT